MAASSARLIVFLSGWDLMSMCVVVCAREFTIAAPRMWLPVFWDPFVYMKALGSHAATKWRTGYRLLLEVCRGVSMGLCINGYCQFIAGLFVGS